MNIKPQQLEGYTYVVDMDLSKFFDRVNHDRLISRLATRIKDKKVNQDKSAVSRPWLRKFLGFTYFQMCGQSKIRIHAKSMKRFKDKVRALTSRKRGNSLISRTALVRDPYAGWCERAPQ